MTPAEFQTWKSVRLQALGLRAEDFQETFSRSSGPGGQNVNKVSTQVTLNHKPTGRAVSVQDTRSQAANRIIAWERLLGAMASAEEEARAAKKHAREKKRRQNAKRPWGLKQRILDSKKKRGAIKKLRSRDF